MQLGVLGQKACLEVLFFFFGCAGCGRGMVGV